MPNGFPCPNPACSHVFLPEAVQGIAAVKCPRCGHTYRFRNTPPAQSRPAPPTPRPAVPAKVPPPPSPPPMPPPPMPPPVALPPVVRPSPANDVEVPVAPALRRGASELAFEANPPPTGRQARAKKKKRRGTAGLVGAFIFLLLAGAVAGGLYYFRDHLPFDDEDDQRAAFKARGNFTIRVPAAWRPDENLIGKFRANLAVSRRKPRGHFVLTFRDYRTRTPTDGEMFDEALKRLRGAFPQFEYVNPFEQGNGGPRGELGGEPAFVFTFSATDATEVALSGECYFFSRQGYAYWLTFWGPADFAEQLAGDYAGIRARFKLYNEREGWKPRPRETTRFVGSKVAFQLHYAREVWKPEPEPEAGDPLAELLLRGREPAEDQGPGPARGASPAEAAEVTALVLPPSPTLVAAAAAAREHVRKQIAQGNPGVKVESIADPKTGQPAIGKQVGAFAGQVERLRVVLGADNERFGLLAVVRRARGVLVVYGECKADRRDYWEQEFKALLESLRPAPKAP